MAVTQVPVGDPKAVKHFSALLMQEANNNSYFGKRFVGLGEESHMPIQKLKDLEGNSGDEISFDLLNDLQGRPVEGDAKLEGKEEELTFYSDNVMIDQMRHAVSAGSKMARKRTTHDLRMRAKQKLGKWFAEAFDTLLFMYLSGARGVNANFKYDLGYTGFAGNEITAPDAGHLLMPGTKTKGTMAATDKMSLSLISVAKTNADMMAADPDTPQMKPVMVDGESRYVMLMNPWQAHDIKSNAETGQWLDIQKAAAGAEGKNSPIFKGTLGMYDDVVMHSHKDVIRFSDYGSENNVAAARALFLGSQAAVMAWGTKGSSFSFGWNEQETDYGNLSGIAASSIFGITKTTFEGKDFGVVAVDTAAAKPTA